MAPQFEWFGIAEAVAEDARSAVTLVGVNQNVIVAPQLPHNAQRVFVVYVYDEDADVIAEGTNVAVDVRIDAPSGQTLLAQHQTATLPPTPNAAVPGAGIQLIFGVRMGLEEYGEYRARAELTFHDASSLASERKFWVTPPPTPQ